MDRRVAAWSVVCFACLAADAVAAIRRVDTKYGVGGGLVVNKGATVVNSLVYNNHAADAGGVWINDPEVNLINCTVVANQADAPDSTGGVWYSPQFIAGWGGNVVNCILWGNIGGALPVEEKQINVDNQPTSDLTVRYCDIEGLDPLGPYNTAINIHNLDVDPRFVSVTPGYEDFRLCSDILCIDAGDVPAVPADTFNAEDPDTNSSEKTPDLALRRRVIDIAGAPNTNGEPDDSGFGCGVVDLGP